MAREARVAGRTGSNIGPTRIRGNIDVPPMLVSAASWSWRLLIVAAVFLGLVLLMNRLTVVVVPIFAAALLAALLHRPVGFLRQRHWPRTLSTWLVLFLGFAVLGGVFYFVVLQVSAQYEQLISQLGGVAQKLDTLLQRLPGGKGTNGNGVNVDNLVSQLTNWLETHRSMVVGGVFTAGRVASEVVVGVILTFFLTYFFLADGDRMWSWVVRLVPRTVAPSINGAGHRAWRVLSGWIVGTATIATIRGTVIGVAMWLIGTPLAVPLAVLIFIGSFIPIVGAVLFGGIAVLVTLLTVGIGPALILLGLLLVENQLEAHILQPFIVERAVHLHPVAIVLVLTGAGVLAGVIGAIVAIPLVAAVNSAVKYLTGIEDIDGRALGGIDRMQPVPPPRVAPLPGYRAAATTQQPTEAQGARRLLHRMTPSHGTTV